MNNHPVLCVESYAYVKEQPAPPPKRQTTRQGVLKLLSYIANNFIFAAVNNYGLAGFENFLAK